MGDRDRQRLNTRSRSLLRNSGPGRVTLCVYAPPLHFFDNLWELLSIVVSLRCCGLFRERSWINNNNNNCDLFPWNNHFSSPFSQVRRSQAIRRIVVVVIAGWRLSQGTRTGTRSRSGPWSQGSKGARSLRAARGVLSAATAGQRGRLSIFGRGCPRMAADALREGVHGLQTIGVRPETAAARQFVTGWVGGGSLVPDLVEMYFRCVRNCNKTL